MWQYYRNEPDLDNNGNIIDFPDDNNNSAWFKFKQKIRGQTGNGDTKVVKIIVSLKYLSNFWRTLEISLINCKISLQLKCFRSCKFFLKRKELSDERVVSKTTKEYGFAVYFL